METRGRILACGGHDFDRRSGNEAITDLIVELAGGRGARICLLPTASGDPEDQIARFRRAVGERGAVPTVISLFRLPERPVVLREELLAQDAIFVGGGSMLNLLAIWRAHELDELLRECLEAGVLLCGQSAGAMCWFEQGLTSSSGTPAGAPGLGFLPGSACVHYRLQPARRRGYLRAVGEGTLLEGYAFEDQTAALFEDGRLVEAMTAREAAGVWRVRSVGGEGVEEEELDRRLLRAPRPAIDESRAEVIELRQTLAVREAAQRGRRSGPGRLD
jgi:peptidase E